VAGPLPLARRREVGEGHALVAAAQLVAGGEGRAGAADDGDAHGVVRVGLLQRGDELAPQAVVEGVALLGPVQREPAHARGGFVDEHERRLALDHALHAGQVGLLAAALQPVGPVVGPLRLARLAHLMAFGSMSPDRRSSSFSGTSSIGVATSATVGPNCLARGASVSRSKP
jgi:hypothetical protein